MAFQILANTHINAYHRKARERAVVDSELDEILSHVANVFQNLYDFGRTAHQVKASKWAAVSLNHALEAEQAFVVLDVQQAYYTTLQQQRLVTVEAKANLAQSQARRETLAQDIRFQVQRAHNEVISAIETIRANEQLIAQAREALRLAQVRYRVNIGSFVELSVAEAAASSAEAQYAQAQYRYKIAQAMLDYTTGRR
jgi:outer membrane protein TolC